MSRKIVPIEELLTNKTWVNYFANRKIEPFFGEALFPTKNIPTMKYEFIIGADEIPVVAHFHAFNSESEIASREGKQKAEAELGLIKRKYTLEEELIKKLSEPRNTDEFQHSIDDLFDDVEKLYQSIRTRLEVARFEVLQTGKLNIKENNINMTLDFKMPSEHKIETGILWDKDADIIGDIESWCSILSANSSTKPTRAVCSTKVLQTLVKNKGIKQAINGVNMEKSIRMSEVNELFISSGLPKFVSYDGKYREEDKTGKLIEKRFLSEDRVVLLPAEKAGDTLYTPTPEHIILKKDPSLMSERIGNIAVMSWFESKDPICWQTKAVTCAMPSFPAAKKIFSAKVF